MKSIYLLPIVILLPAFFLFTGDKDFESLKVLNGAWRMETLKGPLFEQWVVSETSMEGKSFRLKGADTTILENTSIVKRGEDIFYVAVVQDQNNKQPVLFKLVSSTGLRFVFENKEHNFPQRVIYRVINNDSVTARIEGSINGKDKFSDFFYKRLK